VAITPTAAEYGIMTAADGVVIDLDNALVEGRWAPTSEHRLHTMIYRRRPDVGAVIHCHAPLTSLFAASYETLPLVLVETAGCVGHPIEVAPYAKPGSIELGEVCLETMGAGTAVVMGGHGLLVVGPDLARAYSAAVSVEDNARVVVFARAAATPLRQIPDDEAREMHAEWVVDYKPVAVEGPR